MKNKKILILFIVILMIILVVPKNTYANSIDNKIELTVDVEEKEYKKDDVINILIKIKSLPEGEKINALFFKLNFNPEILQINSTYDENIEENIIDIHSYANWTVQYSEESKGILMSRSTWYNNKDQTILKVGFKVINNFKTSNIGIEEIEAGGVSEDALVSENYNIEFSGNLSSEALYLKSPKYKIGDSNAEKMNEYVEGDEYLYRVSPNTTLADFKANLEVTEGAEIKVYKPTKNEAGEVIYTEELADTDLVGTGMKIVVSKEGFENIELLIGVIGDVNENGRIDIGDVTITVENIQITDKDLTEIYKKAGDINENGRIDIGDITQLVVYLQINKFM